MRLAISLLLWLGLAPLSAQDFKVLGGEAQPWTRILRSVGFTERQSGETQIVIVRSGGEMPASVLAAVDRGGLLVLEGESAAAEMLGFRATKQRNRVASVQDIHNPQLRIVWEKALELPVSAVPDGALVTAKERWSGAPLVAGLRRGQGAVIWVATSPGPTGRERYPYLLHALARFGGRPPFRSSRLWAFFDYGYRTRVDVDYMARQWAASGIGALHVAAWHFYDRDPERDAYLRRLIEACHREAILVYAWLELPHVSERFWQEHPEWREKTGLLQDAQLDWRKLMNLQNPDCVRAVRQGVGALMDRFDWDGMNLAELYFESLEGAANPARFTPMNDDVRARYRQAAGLDPVEVLRTKGAGLEKFLEFRAELAREMQEQWLEEAHKLRGLKPYLDVVLTHVDDRFDTSMRAAIGADAARVLPLLDKSPFTFLVEDPATVWHLGPERYSEIAKRYSDLTPKRDRLAIDLNIVERYQNVYPTKQQTGIELFDLVHTAAAAFHRVAVYFEKSIAAADRELLAAAGAVPQKVERFGRRIALSSPYDIGVLWQGPALVDGRPWPLADGNVVWLPAGPHVVEPGVEPCAVQVRRFSGAVRSARCTRDSAELAYRSATRAFAVLARAARAVEIDGEAVDVERHGTATIALPAGQHVVSIR
jgi:hypothetical protein